MPSLETICKWCGLTYGDHFGTDCPKGGMKFFAPPIPDMKSVCGNCGEKYGDHYGPHQDPEAYCREDDWIRRLNGKTTQDRISKCLQFSEEETPRLSDCNQTPTGVGDKVRFRLSGTWVEGIVVEIYLIDAAPYFRLKRMQESGVYDRFREHVESTCEDF